MSSVNDKKTIQIMKLQCQVEVINRQLANLNFKCNVKYLKSTLALGKEQNTNSEYFILHFSTTNKNGIKYKLKCINRLFVKCLHEGKATIRFEEPPHDLCIKAADKIQLQCFLNTLRACLTGVTKNIWSLYGTDITVQFGKVDTVGIVDTEVLPTKLTIRDRAEFPLKGLPRALESLYIVGLKLCNFRRDILMLNNLSVLNLSNNEIEKIPPDFGRLPNLKELHFQNNALGRKEPFDWSWLLTPQITKTLQFLNLSGNQIKALPLSIWKLQNLVTLKLDNNAIVKLPSTIAQIRCLRHLSISKNNLKSLPWNMKCLDLDYLDISYNEFDGKAKTEEKPQWHFINSLVHIASKIILKRKLHYAPDIIPWTLVDFLDTSDRCVCGDPVLTGSHLSFIASITELRQTFKEIVYNGNKNIGFDCYLCSKQCDSWSMVSTIKNYAILRPH